jgi:two-component sensor histidine kinase
VQRQSALATVIDQICTDLVGSDPRFSLNVDAEPIVVPAHTAAIVALIVNELVTNAVKHGYGDVAGGMISMSLVTRLRI